MKRFMIILAASLLLLPAEAQTQQKISKKNLVIEEWNTKAGSTKPVLDHRTVYNPEGKKIDETEYGDNRQKWRKRYEYGADGKVSRELVYDEHNRLVGYKKFEYNEFGRRKTQYNYDAKGRLQTTKVYKYMAEDA
mgnify:CR=1 FL=1